MTKISRYILRNTIAPFFFGISVVILVMVVQFLLNNIDKLLGKGLDDIVIVQLIIYNIAWMLILAVPLGVLFATLMAFGNLSNSSEITIIKASGGSLIRMMFPLFIAASILTYLMFLYSDVVVPETNHRAKVLIIDIQRKKPTFSIEEGQFSNSIDGYIILARANDTATGILKQVTIYDNKSMQINRTINAETCEIVFSDDMKRIDFILSNGEIFQSQNKNVKNYRQIKFDDYILSVPATGFDFEHSDTGFIGRSDREMCINDMQKIVDEAKEDLLSYDERLQNEIAIHCDYLINGIKPDNYEKENIYIENEMRHITSDVRIMRNRYSTNILNLQIQHLNNLKTQAQERISMYEVEIYKKYAIPFACIIFIFIGCPLGIITKGGNFGISAAITLVLYMVYWSCLINGEKLADRMLINPFLGMWLGNIVLGVIGIFLTLKVNNETLSLKKIIKKKVK
ncbi:MAG: LptF/LptG family permease [Bacteroidetes bacterium]|nr:LptF/LptG family permease [Bacteroidota bacterium]